MDLGSSAGRRLGESAAIASLYLCLVMWVPSDSGSEDGAGCAGQPGLQHASRSRSISRSRSRSRCRSTSSESAGRADSQGQSSHPAMAQPYPRPEQSKGTDWWAPVLYTAVEHLRMKLPRQPFRPMTHQSLLTGMMTESFGFDAVGMNVTTQIAVDCKSAAAKWIACLRSDKYEHFFDKLEDVVQGCGACRVHGRTCQVPSGPDLLTAGLCCQPFSGARDQRTTKPRDHPLFKVTFEDFVELMQKSKPNGFCVEQVLGFGREDADHPAGLSYLQQLVNLMADMGYSIRVFQMDASLWSEGERKRCPPRDVF